MQVFRLDEARSAPRIKLAPRVPFNRMACEDANVRRVCAAPTLKGCLRAMYAPTGSRIVESTPERMDKLINPKEIMELFVYTGEFNEPYSPSPRELPDVQHTGEVWSLKPVVFKRAGRVQIVRTRADHVHWVKL